jgi:hypothetical protein
MLSGGVQPAAQTPYWHVSAPVHACPQVPQLVLLCSRLVSQPSVGSLLQSPNPELQAPITQLPAAHGATAALANEQGVLCGSPQPSCGSSIG